MKKMEKYHDLVRELRKLWDMKIVIIPIVLGALGTNPKDITEENEGHWH